MKSPNQIEKDFDQFFDETGFKRVSEIVGESPNFLNSDYVNELDKVLVELKVIDKDFFRKGGIIDSLNTIVTVPQNLDEQGFGQYTFELPPIRRGKHDSFEEPLKRILKKANKQIRETNDHLFNGKGIGFVMIVMNSQTLINPTIIRDLIVSILERSNSALAGFILISAPLDNTYVQYPNAIVQPNTAYGSDQRTHNLCVQIAQQWCTYFEKKKV